MTQTNAISLRLHLNNLVMAAAARGISPVTTSRAMPERPLFEPQPEEIFDDNLRGYFEDRLTRGQAQFPTIDTFREA